LVLGIWDFKDSVDGYDFFIQHLASGIVPPQAMQYLRHQLVGLKRSFAGIYAESTKPLFAPPESSVMGK
jgi:hypothetical protein